MRGQQRDQHEAPQDEQKREAALAGGSLSQRHVQVRIRVGGAADRGGLQRARHQGGIRQLLLQVLGEVERLLLVAHDMRGDQHQQFLARAVIVLRAEQAASRGMFLMPGMPWFCCELLSEISPARPMVWPSEWRAGGDGALGEGGGIEPVVVTVGETPLTSW